MVTVTDAARRVVETTGPVVSTTTGGAAVGEMPPALPWKGSAESSRDDRAGRLYAAVHLRRVRGDALPEHTRYRDDGCDIHEHCLTCPLPRCRYDEPGGLRALLNAYRDRQIIELRRRGAPVDRIAERFRLSRRTVFRILSTRHKAAVSTVPPPGSPGGAGLGGSGDGAAFWQGTAAVPGRSAGGDRAYPARRGSASGNGLGKR